MDRTSEVASGAESDLVIHCEDSVFHVHRSVLSLASPVFEKMLNGEFAESMTSTIVFEEDSPDALNYVLEILYYSEKLSRSVRDSCALELTALVDKYELKGVGNFLAYVKENEKEVDHLQAEIRDIQASKRAENNRLRKEIDTLQQQLTESHKSKEKEIARLRAERQKVEQAYKADSKAKEAENSILKAELYKKMKWSLRNLQPGMMVRYTDEPPVGTRVELAEGFLLAGSKGTITRVGEKKCAKGILCGLYTVQWDSGMISNVDEYMVKYA